MERQAQPTLMVRQAEEHRATRPSPRGTVGQPRGQWLPQYPHTEEGTEQNTEQPGLLWGPEHTL